eukprot:TRINITY_DN659_c0_g1_i1.p1 TRINITY_DN659_c0_g1~~TRINITY_DN659_c0_g1_i1.p1  ORF type:complete len:748 (-),score=73.29 TRINITY_DN659_c0_g1_i1:429-2642(-)
MEISPQLRPLASGESSSTSSSEATQLNVALIGSCNTGKSSLGGMIMEQTKSMDSRALERIRKVFADYWGGRLFCPGWYLDVKRIERERGVTVDGNICQATLLNGNKIVIFDTPGHRSFWMKAINFICQSDVVVIALDSREPVDIKYSSRFMTIASYAYMFKVRQVIIAFTMLDLAGLPTADGSKSEPFSEARFRQLERTAREGLKKIGFRDEHIIGCVPTSTTQGGLNILSTTGHQMPWYQTEPSLVDLIQRCKSVGRNREGPGILQVQKFVNVRVNGGTRTIISGAVLRGKISQSELMIAVPSMEEARIQSIEKFRADTHVAVAGDTVGVAMNGTYRSYEIRSLFNGFLVSARGKDSAIPPASSCFVLDAMFVKNQLGKRQKPLLGGALTVTTRLGSVIGVIIKIEAILSQKNFKPIDVDVTTISAGQLARVVIRCYSKLNVGEESKWPELSRVVLSDTISIVGAGIVRRLTDPKMRIVNSVTIRFYGYRYQNGTSETFSDVEVRHRDLCIEELNRDSLRQVSVVTLRDSPKIGANSKAFKCLMEFVESGGTLWVCPSSTVEQTDVCAHFGLAYRQIVIPGMKEEYPKIYSIPLGIIPREKRKENAAETTKGPVSWSQLRQQWLEIAEKEKKARKTVVSSGRKTPHKDFLWLPTDCLLEIFRALGHQSLGSLFKCALLVSKPISELFSKHKDIWVDSVSHVGGIPFEYLHGGAADVTQIESGCFSQLISSRYGPTL